MSTILRTRFKHNSLMPSMQYKTFSY